MNSERGRIASPAAADTGDAIASLPALLSAPAGAWLATRWKLPVPCLLGPIFATATNVLAGNPAPAVPPLLLNAALIFFGTYFVILIPLEHLRRMGKVFAYALGGSAFLLLFTSLLGYGLTFLTPASFLTTFLSTAPGGLSELGAVALALHANAAFVTAYQLFRLFSILLLVPVLLRWRFRH